MTSIVIGFYNTISDLFSGRVYNGIAPSGVLTPYAVYNKITGSNDYTLNEGHGDLAEAVFQVDIYADTAIAVDAAATIIKDRLNLKKCVVNNTSLMYDQEYNLYRYTLDFHFWYRE